MSAARMLVLGVARSLGRAHGYQIRRELVSWRVDIWAKIAPGSIYQALRTLAKHELLEPVGTESGGGPERTVYRITPDGETEFLHLVRTAISDPGTGPESLNAAFAFLPVLPGHEIAELLDYRVRALEARLVEIEPLQGETPSKPQHIEALGRLYAAQLRVEIDWARDLARRVREGTYRFEDSPIPGDHTNQA